MLVLFCLDCNDLTLCLCVQDTNAASEQKSYDLPGYAVC